MKEITATELDLDLGTIELEVESLEANPASDFKTIAIKFAETRDNLRQEISAIRERLRLGDQGQEITPLTTQDEVEDFKRQAFARFNIASRAAQKLEDLNHDKNPQESQKLMDDLVRATDQFFVDMKIVQFHQAGFVVDACSALEKEEDAAQAPQHVANIRRNLDNIAAMPNLDSFADLSADIAKMASVHTQISAFADSINDKEKGLVITESLASRTLSANISQASRAIIQPFNDFVTKASAAEKVSAEFDIKRVGEIEEQVTFINDLSENFENALIIAGAVVDGKVQRGQSRVEYALGAMQNLVNIAAPAGIRQGANGFLQAAQFVVAAKKDAQFRNVAGFATIADGVEATDEERKIRQNIIHEVARKIYSFYGHKDEEGKSPLDTFSEVGKKKVASLLVEEFVTQLGDFKFPDSTTEPFDREKFAEDAKYRSEVAKKYDVKIDEKIIADETKAGKSDYLNESISRVQNKISINHAELPPFDREKFAQDSEYRSEMAQKHDIEIDERKISGPRYLSEAISRVENKIYIDHVSNMLIGQVIHGSEGGKFAEIASKVRFEKADLTPERQGKNFTLQGLRKRVGIMLEDGTRYLPAGREKDGEDVKYGFRLATAAEARVLQSGGEIVGYKLSSRPKEQKQEKTTEVAPALVQELGEKAQEAPQILHDPKAVISEMQDLALRQVEKHIAQFTLKQTKIASYIDKSHEDLTKKLADATKDLAEKSKPKPRWKRILTVVTANLYSGGKPNNVEAENKLVLDLKDRVAQNRKDSELLKKQTENIQGLRQDFMTALSTKTEKQGVDLGAVLDPLRKIANLVEASQEVVEAVQSHKAVNWGDAQRKVGFTQVIAESFRQGFVIAEALKDGKVQFSDDRVDKALSAGQMITGFVPPVAQQGMALALQVGQVVNAMKKSHNANTLANFGTELGESGHEMRPQIMQAIGDKLHDTFSVRSAGKSILDNFTQSGVDKFADTLTARIMDQVISYNMPNRDEVEKFSREKFDSDEQYREKITQKYGSRIDEKMVAKINDDLYADTVANQLIGKVLQTRAAGLSLDNFRFEEVDLADHAKGKGLTIEGMIYRCGVMTSDGHRYIPESRAKDLQNADSKYGYRAATLEEETQMQQNGGVLTNYAKFNPAMQLYEVAKAEALQKLTAANFKEGAVVDGDVAGALQKMVENYRKQKEEKPDLRHGDFLKEDQTLDNGKSKKLFGVVVGRDAARKEFNKELIKPLLALLDAADRLSLAELRGDDVNAKPVKSVVDGVKLTDAPDVSDIFAVIKSAPPRDLKDLQGLEQFADTREEIAHISSKINASESTDALSAVSASIMESIGDISEQLVGKKTPVMVQVVEEKPDQKSLVDYVESRDSLLKMLNDSHLTDEVAAKHKGEIDQGKSAKVLENCVTDFVESYHAKLMAVGSNDEVARADLIKFAADNLPIKTENPIIAGKLISLAVQYSDAMIEKAQNKQAQQVQVTTHNIADVPAVTISMKDQLLSDLHEMAGLGEGGSLATLGAFKASVVEAGGKVEGDKITMPPMVVAGEGKKPVNFVVVVDPKTHQFLDVELHGGDVKGTKLFSSENKRQLFDKAGNIKASHVVTVQDVMAKYQERLGSAEVSRASESVSRESEIEGRKSISLTMAKTAKSMMKSPMSMIKKIRASREAPNAALPTAIHTGGFERQ